MPDSLTLALQPQGARWPCRQQVRGPAASAALPGGAEQLIQWDIVEFVPPAAPGSQAGTTALGRVAKVWVWVWVVGAWGLGRAAAAWDWQYSRARRHLVVLYIAGDVEASGRLASHRAAGYAGGAGVGGGGDRSWQAVGASTATTCGSAQRLQPSRGVLVQ